MRQGDGGDKEKVPQAAVNAGATRVPVERRRPRAEPKTEWTVGELYRAVLPEQAWPVAELLPAGLTTLAGRPKLGKSLLALQLAAAVASGDSFLGREVRAGPVLYLALEDTPQRLRERLGRLGVSESAPMRIHSAWPGLAETAGLLRLLACVARMRARLVVIDTLSRALTVSRAMRPELLSTVMTSLQQMAHRCNCGVVTVDHHRKQGRGGDVVNDLLGSTSKAAALDTVWGLYAARAGGGVILRVTGREVAPCDLALEFDADRGRWEVRAEPEAEAKETGAADVERALAELGGRATTSELATAMGKSVGSVSHALAKLVKAGRVRRLAREGHRVPYEVVVNG